MLKSFNPLISRDDIWPREQHGGSRRHRQVSRRMRFGFKKNEGRKDLDEGKAVCKMEAEI